MARCIACARATGSGVAAVPLKDTVAQCDAKDGMTAPLIRDRLRAMQTPQGFRANWLREAYACARREGWTATDDASLVMRCGYPVQLVMGELENIKLTTPEDMLLCEAILRKRQAMVVRTEPPRVGHGYDAHRLVAERALVLCGQTIPYEKGLLGHSDADVAVHALMDALLGAAGLGDIGRHFPDADPAYAGISSMCLLNAVLQKVATLVRGLRAG
ncbi:MAG: 2-C-methyl-D-erythritol 2,4-cyclodiphosphate synthase, partial [Clostridia bacterium]